MTGMFTDDGAHQPLHDWQCHLLRRHRRHQVHLHPDQSPAGGQRGLQEDQVPLPRHINRRDSLHCSCRRLLSLAARQTRTGAVSSDVVQSLLGTSIRIFLASLQTAATASRSNEIIILQELQQICSGLLVVYYFCIIYGNFFLYKYLEKHTENNKAVQEADKKKDRQRNIIPARASFHCALLLVTSFMVYSICYSIPVLYTGVLRTFYYSQFKCCSTRISMPQAVHTSCPCTVTSTPASWGPPQSCSGRPPSEGNSSQSLLSGSRCDSVRLSVFHEHSCGMGGL